MMASFVVYFLVSKSLILQCIMSINVLTTTIITSSTSVQRTNKDRYNVPDCLESVSSIE